MATVDVPFSSFCSEAVSTLEFTFTEPPPPLFVSIHSKKMPRVIHQTQTGKKKKQDIAFNRVNRYSKHSLESICKSN